MKKKLLVALFAVVGSTSAMAAALPWTVNELAVDAARGGNTVAALGELLGRATTFSANNMSLVYEATITQGAFNQQGIASFTETGRVQLSNYYTGYVPDGVTQGTAVSSALGSVYSLWATFTVTGTAQINGNQLNVTVGSGSLTAYADFHPGGENLSQLDQDAILGTAASILSGGAVLTNLGNNNAGNGSFEIIWSDFERAAFGAQLWPAPNPFHMTLDINSDVDGIAGAFAPGGTVAASGGQGNAYFASVPEPSAIALLGLGLVGAGFSSRKRKSA